MSDTRPDLDLDELLRLAAGGFVLKGSEVERIAIYALTLRDTLARRSAAHDRLTHRLDQIRALADDWDADWREDLNVVELHAELRRALDGDQQTKDTP